VIQKKVPLKELHSEIINAVKYARHLHAPRKIKVSKITIEIVKIETE